jgi:hypothetical protein
MAGVFACPECGLELGVEGLSPGREVQCEGCSTWVEVPFLPRASAPKRGQRPTPRSPWASKTLQGAISFAAVVLMVLITIQMIGGRVRSDKERVLAELVASADQAESSRRYDVALREIEAALSHARSFERKDSWRLLELESRRDRISLLEAKARLAGIEALDPDSAVGEALTLAAKAREDPALAPLATKIEYRLAAARTCQAEVDLGLARRAFDSCKDAEAFAFADRLYTRAKDLPEPDSRRYIDEAEALLEAVVGRSGVTLPPVAGRFVAGSAEDYASSLDRLRAESLKAKGYLPQPRQSPWASLWDEKAPFVQKVEVAENQDGLYLQSKHRTTLIDGTFELLRKDQVVWTTRLIGRTRSPLPNLPAYLAGHLATSDKRNPDVEKMLQADALVQFAELAARNLRGLPTREAATRTPGP